MIKPSLIVDMAIQLLYIILILGALLTWIPRMPLHKPPFNVLVAICDVFFNPFRKIIPPLAGIDFSPIFAFILIGFVGKIIIEVLIRYNL